MPSKLPDAVKNISVVAALNPHKARRKAKRVLFGFKLGDIPIDQLQLGIAFPLLISCLIC